MSHPTIRTRRLLPGRAALLAIVAIGCAVKTLPPEIPDRLRAELGAVAVVIPPGSYPDADLAYPVPGGAVAAVTGASAGLGVGVLAGAACLGTYGILWPACFVALWTPVMMATGAVEGAVKSVPIGEFRASVVAVKDAAREPAAARDLGERVAREATRRLGEGRARFAPDGDTAGANTVLELRFERVALERVSEPGPLATYGPSFSVEWLIDAPLTLVVEVRVRLVRSGDGARLWERTFTRREGRRKLADWGRDGAAEFRERRDRMLAALAEDIAVAVSGPAPSGSAPAEPERGDRSDPP